MMERWEAKIIAIAVSFTLPFIFTLLPYPMASYVESKGLRGQIVINRLMCFGGGIFFGTFLLHMGPETRLLMDEYLLKPNDITYPLTDLIMGCGFFFVLFLEKIVMRVNKRRMQAHRLKQQEKCALYKKVGSLCCSCAHDQPCEGFDGVSASENDVHVKSTSIPSRISLQVADIEDATRKSSISHMDSTVDIVTSSNDDLSTSSSATSASHQHHHHGQHHHGADDDEMSGHHNIRSLILIMALSLHHLFEGISLGLQHTVGQVFTLLLALMCHETIISFSLGLQFVKCNYTIKRFIITTFCVSIIMPLGVAIGTAMMETGSESDEIEIANGIMQAFASGTFIFVTFFEILQEEIDPHDTSIGKIACAALGFIMIALLILIPEESYHHGSEIDSLMTTSGDLMSNFVTGAMKSALS